jgi:hypothetical protein
MERGTDWLALASDFAIRMLPQIFRKGDPVLEVTLQPETRHELEKLFISTGHSSIADDTRLPESLTARGGTAESSWATTS